MLIFSFVSLPRNVCSTKLKSHQRGKTIYCLPINPCRKKSYFQYIFPLKKLKIREFFLGYLAPIKPFLQFRDFRFSVDGSLIPASTPDTTFLWRSSPHAEWRCLLEEKLSCQTPAQHVEDRIHHLPPSQHLSSQLYWLRWYLEGSLIPSTCLYLILHKQQYSTPPKARALCTLFFGALKKLHLKTRFKQYKTAFLVDFQVVSILATRKTKIIFFPLQASAVSRLIFNPYHRTSFFFFTIH